MYLVVLPKKCSLLNTRISTLISYW